MDRESAHIHELVLEVCSVIDGLGPTAPPSEACACTLECLRGELLALVDTADDESRDAARHVVALLDIVLLRSHVRAA
jgi:hypothetical protein